jgi:hypothetical protein
MKSVLPSVTEMIRRPRIACRNPRATVSTSGSSGIEGRTFKIAQRCSLCSAQGKVISRCSANCSRGPRKKTKKQISRVRDGSGAACCATTKKIALELLLVIVRIRRMLRDHHWIFLQGVQCGLHRLFELPVVARRDRRRIVFHFNIRRDSPVLHFPFAF